MQTNSIVDVWPNSARHVWHWTRRGFGGDPVGLSSERGTNHHKHAHEILVSGLTAGSTGHLPSSTLVIGRCHFYQADQLLVVKFRNERNDKESQKSDVLVSRLTRQYNTL